MASENYGIALGMIETRGLVPAIEAGSWGVYVPHDLTWVMEHAEPPTAAPRFRELAHLGELVELVRSL